MGRVMNDWDKHLEKTSRTFALSIPLLEEPLRREVTVSYLLFRVADTLEDAAVWSPQRRSAELQACAQVVHTWDTERAALLASRWIELAPTQHAGYLALLEAFPSLLADAGRLRPASVQRIEHHLLRTIERMDTFVRGADARGIVVLRSRQELEDYCYAVAGIVGELLTDLFLMHVPRLADASTVLGEHARAFGEGLQLVNIARDAVDDRKEGRTFIPSDMSVEDVLELAHQDLDRATIYVDALRRHGAPSGMIAFVALPVALARATLHRVSSDGAGAKLTRAEVALLMRQVQEMSVFSSPVE
jgi:farnesyl-diphosphate farnesyltransferase